jgi:hypothetical protein
VSSAVMPAWVVPTQLFKPILIGGAVAGTLDQISAFISLGWNVPRVDAAGLLGPQVIHGSEPWVWILGLALHYFIALSAAAIYCFATRRLGFLKEHLLICGLFYGIAVFLTMYLVVMPLCAIHYKGPYTLHTLLEGVIVHMLLIGLPIAFSLRKWSEQ